jgi:hypothetical protein
MAQTRKSKPLRRSRTEIHYFEATKKSLPREFHVKVNILISNATGQPKKLLQIAQNHDYAQSSDATWIVCDVEWPARHSDLEDVVYQAEKLGIRMALSNPCFESWLIWHIQDTSSQLSSREAKKLFQALTGHLPQHFDMDDLLSARPVATNRAKTMAGLHVYNGTHHLDRNPSSDIYQLLDELYEL